jgi:hypothetical protein
VVTFFLSKEVFKKDKPALLTALLVSVSPMAIIFSRSTSDGVIESVFVLLGLIFFILAIKNRKAVILPIVYFFWLLAYFTYQTSRVIIPLVSVPSMVIANLYFKSGSRFAVLSFLPILFFLLFPLLFFAKSPIGQGRFAQVSVFTYPEVQRDLDEQIREDGNREINFVTRLFHNKLVGYTYDIFERYLYFFSPQTVLSSLSQPDRYFVPHVGAISYLEFAGVIFFISFLIVKKKKLIGLVPAVLFLIAPVPSALTFEATPNFQRAMYMVPAWQILSGIGICYFIANLENKQKRIFVVAATTVFLWQMSYFTHQYFIHEPKRLTSILSRNTEYLDLSYALRLQVLEGKKILISERGGPSIYYLFFNKLTPGQFNVTKPGKYYSGSFTIDDVDYVDMECPDLDSFLNKQYNIVVLFKQCQQPKFGIPLTYFYRSDGSLASIMYDLAGSNQYKVFYERYRLASNSTDKQEIKSDFGKVFVSYKDSQNF